MIIYDKKGGYIWIVSCGAADAWDAAARGSGAALARTCSVARTPSCHRTTPRWLPSDTGIHI